MTDNSPIYHPYCLKVPTNSLGDFSTINQIMGYGKRGQRKDVDHTSHSPCYGYGIFFPKHKSVFATSTERA